MGQENKYVSLCCHRQPRGKNSGALGCRTGRQWAPGESLAVKKYLKVFVFIFCQNLLFHYQKTPFFKSKTKRFM